MLRALSFTRGITPHASVNRSIHDKIFAIRDAFQIGDSVAWNPHGVGKIVAVEDKGSAGPCFVVVFASGLRTFLPVNSAQGMMRKLATKEEATLDLEFLRGEQTVETVTRKPREVREEQQRLLRSGSRSDRIAALRALYGANHSPSEANTRAIRALEDLVLEEIAIVLEIPRSTLDEEMRMRYPVLTKPKKSAAK